MSGSAAKTTRRDLRRAFGEDVVRSLEDILAKHTGQFGEVAEKHNVLVEKVRDLDAWWQRSVFGRLRWLFLGR